MKNHATLLSLAWAVFTPGPAGARGAELYPERDWWQDRVWYEVFVRSFADSTEGPLANDGVGDLRGLIERLDYLNDGDPDTTDDLGVTGIWLMPVNESPSYHGYDVVDYLSVDSEYGTVDDMKELVEACHDRGIAVIIDLVINHTSNQHPWFVEAADPASERHDWYVWSDRKPGWNGPWGQPAWHAQKRAESGKWYYGVFWHGMPDLNWRNPDVEQAVVDFSWWWLREIGIDGFRLDAVKLLVADGPREQEHTDATLDALARYNAALKDEFPDCFIVGEVWDGTSVVAPYLTPREAGGGVGRSSALDSAFEFDLSYGIVEGVRDGDAVKVAERLERAWQTHREHAFSTFLTNHDQSRVADALARDPEKLRLAATLLLTMPGAPFLYYGEEVGLRGSKPDEDIRRPMPWDASEHAGFTRGTPWREPWPEFNTVNVSSQAALPDSLLSTYRDAIRLRTADERLRSGGVVVLNTGRSDVLAYLRTGGDGSGVLVVANLGGLPVYAYRLGGRGTGLARYLDAAPLLGEAEVRAPKQVMNGTLTGYKPVKVLEPETAYVIELTPAARP
ncbi:MAG: alpha-amylase family glycosyl hydrolase [Planctomycetota bacterium]